jgi:hypothetical protein
MLTIRTLMLTAALAAGSLPACADPVHAAGPTDAHAAQGQGHAAAAESSDNDVPDPASLALLGLGVLGLLACRRKV